MQLEDEPAPMEEPAAVGEVEAPGDVEPAIEAAAPVEAASTDPDPMDFGSAFDIDEGDIAKEALKAEVADGLAGTKPDKAVVGELLLALEAQNPTPSPATSPLLQGKWKFLYASAASPALKTLSLMLRGAGSAPKSPSGADLIDVADTYLTIGATQPRAMAEVKVRLLSLETTLKLESTLEAESAVRLVETYESAESESLNLKLPLTQSPAQYKRSMLVSYLDDEIMVVRDAMGRPDVMMRVTEGSSSEEGFENTSDDETPGAS